MKTRPGSVDTSTADDVHALASVDRRHLFRRAGVLAGTMGAAAALTATGARPSAAAEGEALQLGHDNQASTTTGLQLGGDKGSESPALSLSNVGGPVLRLVPQDSYSETLAIGEIVNLATGPIIGIDPGTGPQNDYLALGTDLAAIPTPIAFAPVRVLDTRRHDDDRIIATSSRAFDSAHRLRPGAWIDIALLEWTPTYTAQAAFVNITSTGSLKTGYVSVYAPGRRPETSSLNYKKGVSTSNAGFFATGLTKDYVALRVYASAATHVLLDVTGYTIVQQTATPASSRAASRSGRRLVSAAKARARLLQR